MFLILIFFIYTFKSSNIYIFFIIMESFKNLLNKLILYILIPFFVIFSFLIFQVNADEKSDKILELLKQLWWSDVSVDSWSTNSWSANSNTGSSIVQPNQIKESQTSTNSWASQTSTWKLNSSILPNKDIKVNSTSSQDKTNPQTNNSTQEVLNNTSSTTNVSSTTVLLWDSQKPKKTEFIIKKIETWVKKVTVTFSVINDTPEIKKFEFAYTDKDNYTNKIITFNKENFINSSWDYVWYIPDLKPSKYNILISWVNSSWDIIPWITSNSFEADLSLWNVANCIIPNVTWLRTVTVKDTSILHWNRIPEAIKYKIFIKNEFWDYNFIAETKANFYNIHIKEGSVKYEEFSVKAVCSDLSESVDFEASTLVKTWPPLFILFFVSVFLSSILIKKFKKTIDNK